MTNAAKHFDPQIGIDIHMYELPPGPLPTAHISIVLDPFDYLPFIGATVQVAGVKRAIAGTGGLSVHIPLGIWMPPMRAPEGPQFDDEIFMGSKTVLADDSPFSRLGMPVLDCSVVGMVPPFRLKKPEKPHMSMSLPTAVNLAIPDTVFIGGPPTISMMAIATKLGFAALGKGFKALRKTKGFQRAEEAFNKARQKLFKDMEPGFLKCKVLRAEPVDIRDGSVSVSQLDFSIPGRLSLTWRRAYSSNSYHEGMCGYGWQTPADFRLEIDSDGVVMFFEANGAAVFPQLPEAAGADHAVMEFVDGARLSWVINDGIDELRVVTKDDLRYVFHKPPSNLLRLHQVSHLKIQRIEDLSGNCWRFERTDGHLTRIIESGTDELPGRFIEVHETAGKIHQLSLHDPATGLNRLLTAYRYQDQDLAAATDALGAARIFAYDRHHMVRHTDRLGQSFHYTYDSEWRVMHAWGEQGLHDYRFSYNVLLRETEVTDSLGHISLVKFDENNLPLCEIDPLGGVTVFEYDEVGRTTAIVDAVGARTEFTYDERGNLLRLLQADGSVTVMVFDGANHVVELVDPLGQSWRRSWDERGLLLEQRSPGGAHTRYAYDANGQLQTHVNARGATVALIFDRYGNLSQLTDALGQSSYFEHDAIGCLTRHTSPAGVVTEYRYDAKGRLLQVNQASRIIDHCNYDAEDQLISHTDRNGARTRMEYFGTGQLAKHVQANGELVQYFYNTEEQLIGLVNQRKENYRFKRDALGRIVEEVDYWEQVRQYRYDAGGNLLSATDPLGRTISYATDRLGRVIKKSMPDSDHPALTFQEIFSYDKNGALIETRNPHRRILRKFDADGRLTEESQDGFLIEYRYDEVGNRILRRSGAGNTLVFTHDLCDRVATIAINGEAPVLIERDALGRVIGEQLSEQLRRELRYDEVGHLTAQTVLRDQLPLFTTAYEYDSAGNQIKSNDSEHGSNFYQYDPLGNILRHTDPAGRVAEFLNDPAGDRLHTKIRQLEMKQAAGADSSAEVMWSREGSSDGWHYAFDRAGNLTQRSQGSTASAADHTLRLRWDANQRLIESKQGGQVFRYGYDPLGRRVFKRSPVQTTWFFWDGDALLGEVRQNNKLQNDAEIWLAPNVADLIAVRKRLAALKRIHAQVREYVYYPQTFVPLALLDPQMVVTGKAAPRAAVNNAAASAARTAPPLSQVLTGNIVPGAGGTGGMGGLGSIRLGLSNEAVPVPPQAGLAGLGKGVPLGGGPFPVAASSITLETKSTDADAAPAKASSGVFYYHNDRNGCPLRLTDDGGRVVWSASYAAWGELQQLLVDDVDNPIRLQGQYHDEETGLHYNRHRYYDPVAGQFVGQDPIGLAGGDNLYQYAPNAISWMDPWGLAYSPVDFTGSPDLFPVSGTQKNIVQITMQGGRSRDFRLAYIEAGITKEEAKGYTWHHAYDFDPATGKTTMQLVRRDAHEATFPHAGSAEQFAKHFGVEYDSNAAVDAAHKKGWLEGRKPKVCTCAGNVA